MDMAFMLQNRKTYALAVVITIAILAISALYLSDRDTEQGRFAFIIGIGTHGNYSSEEKALSNGVLYYRNDITLNVTLESQISQENKQYGASYLGILDYDTLPMGISNKNWTLAEWNASVAEALHEYPEINTWEIWNEPLVPLFETGFMNGSAYNYFLVLRSAYKIIKASEPNSTVVCFGGAPISDPEAFLWYAQLWSYGASSYCDAISLHAYPQNTSLDKATKQAWTTGIGMYENLTGKPIWITEVGIPATSYEYPSLYSPEGQEAFLLQSFSFFNNFTYVKRVYWYDLWGLSDGQAGNDFGLLNYSNPLNSPNPAWVAFLEAYKNSLSINS